VNVDVYLLVVVAICLLVCVNGMLNPWTCGPRLHKGSHLLIFSPTYSYVVLVQFHVNAMSRWYFLMQS
jgi:hypothetical protein